MPILNQKNISRRLNPTFSLLYFQNFLKADPSRLKALTAWKPPKPESLNRFSTLDTVRLEDEFTFSIEHGLALKHLVDVLKLPASNAIEELNCLWPLEAKCLPLLYNKGLRGEDFRQYCREFQVTNQIPFLRIPYSKNLSIYHVNALYSMMTHSKPLSSGEALSIMNSLTPVQAYALGKLYPYGFQMKHLHQWKPFVILQTREHTAEPQYIGGRWAYDNWLKGNWESDLNGNFGFGHVDSLECLLRDMKMSPIKAIKTINQLSERNANTTVSLLFEKSKTEQELKAAIEYMKNDFIGQGKEKVPNRKKHTLIEFAISREAKRDPSLKKKESTYLKPLAPILPSPLTLGFFKTQPYTPKNDALLKLSENRAIMLSS